MKALIIEHDHVSPPGPVAERLRHHGFELFEQVVVTQDNFGTPNVSFNFPDPAEYDLVVVLGAPWGVWDDEGIGNWLLKELQWVRNIVESDQPLLGICFGGQLIARAMGGSVSPAPKCEIGWMNIWSDELSILSNGPWFQFHYDRWQLPPGANEIARNPIASQAFIINHSLAVQFHPETSFNSLQGWLSWGGEKLVKADGQDPAVMLAQTKAFEADAKIRTFELIDAFLTKIAKLI